MANNSAAGASSSSSGAAAAPSSRPAWRLTKEELRQTPSHAYFLEQAGGNAELAAQKEIETRMKSCSFIQAAGQSLRVYAAPPGWACFGGAPRAPGLQKGLACARSACPLSAPPRCPAGRS